MALGGQATRQRAFRVIVRIRGGPHERGQACTSQELHRALHDLDVEPKRVKAGDWPAGLRDLDLAGLYSWWADEPGAADLSLGLGVRMQAGRIYVGQAGATKWPSGKIGNAILQRRIGAQHLRGNVRGSTLRRTLAAALMRALDLKTSAPRRLDADSERRLLSCVSTGACTSGRRADACRAVERHTVVDHTRAIRTAEGRSRAVSRRRTGISRDC